MLKAHLFPMEIQCISSGETIENQILYKYLSGVDHLTPEHCRYIGIRSLNMKQVLLHCGVSFSVYVQPSNTTHAETPLLLARDITKLM